ncbi:MAG TPA: gamma carbonic anhydrase family protein [Thermodesulfobacteriota bacterium]|nr:gamma carbonic anhydrase family protein [Thermodesulfobacteriota bacterium]
MIYSLGELKVEIKGSDYYIADNAVVIGSVIIHNNVSIWYNAVIRGDYEPIIILEDTNIQDGVVIHTDAGAPATIGRGVTVGHQAMLHGCTIGDNSLIGINAVLLNNSRIGKNCIIGANCLIPQGKVIPDNSMVLGSPGKVLREVTPTEIEDLKSTARHYVNNFKRFKKELKLQD